MIIVFLIIALIIGFIRKGSLRNLADLKIKFFPLIILAFLIQISIYVGYKMELSFIMSYDVLLHFISYIVLFAGLMSNFDNKWFVIITMGVICNFVVIFLNGGRMPVSLSAASTIGITDGLQAVLKVRGGTHQLLNSNAILPLLADIIPVPLPSPIDYFSNIYSIGDIILYLGTMGLVQSSMLSVKDSELIDEIDLEDEDAPLNMRNDIEIKNEPYIDNKYTDSNKTTSDNSVNNLSIDDKGVIDQEIKELINTVPPYSQNIEDGMSKHEKLKNNDLTGLMKKDYNLNLQEVDMEIFETEQSDDSNEETNIISDDGFISDVTVHEHGTIPFQEMEDDSKIHSDSHEILNDNIASSIWGNNNIPSEYSGTDEESYNKDVNIDNIIYDGYKQNNNGKQLETTDENKIFEAHVDMSEENHNGELDQDLQENNYFINDNNDNMENNYEDISFTKIPEDMTESENENANIMKEYSFMNFTSEQKDEIATDNIDEKDIDNFNYSKKAIPSSEYQEIEVDGIDTVHQFIIIDGKIVENPNYQKKVQVKNQENEEEIQQNINEKNHQVEEITMNQTDINDNKYKENYKTEIDRDLNDSEKHMLLQMSDGQRVDLMRKMKERKENGYNFVEIEVGGKKVSFWKRDHQ